MKLEMDYELLVWFDWKYAIGTGYLKEEDTILT